jgi:hypothetical protein
LEASSVKKIALLLGATSILVLTAAAGCGDDTGGNGGNGGAGASSSTNTGSTGSTGGTGGMDGTGGGTGGMGGGTGGMGGGGNGAKARVRVAHLSPGAPAVDVCIKPAAAANFEAPVLKGLGAKEGLAYPNITTYLELAPGEYVARLVAPNAANCSKALADLPDITGIKVEGDESYTLAAIGELAPGAKNAFQVKPYVDDAAAPASGKMKLRFVHTSPDAPNVDVGVVAGSTFVPLFPNVAYPTEGKGYLEAAPVSGATISVRLAGMPTEVLKLANVTIPANATVTAWAIGKATAMPNSPTPLAALVCVDSAPAKGVLTDCSVLP